MEDGAKQPTSKRTANLKPRWKKGQSGNPNGRPPTAKCIPDLLRWSGALIAPESLVSKMRQVFEIPEHTQLTVDQACILRSRMEAMNGSVQHLEFWANRTEGKVRDVIALEGGQRLEIVEEIVDANAH